MRASRVLALGLSTLLVACSENDAPPDMALVGPEGGRVGLGGLVLEIPPGALALETQIRVAETDPFAFNFEGTPAGDFYFLEPTGLVFTKPAVVRIDTEGVARPHVVWSRQGNPIVLDPLDTVVEAGVAIANVTHFSVGGVVSAPLTPDAGPTDAEVPDLGPAPDAAPPDGGVADAELEDLGTPDAEPEDLGVADASDAGVPDVPTPDLGTPDTGPADLGVTDSGLMPEIAPTALNIPDACLTVTTTLSVVGGGPATTWQAISPVDLSITHGVIGYANAALDPVTGVLTFGPTGTLSGYARGFGARATLPGGQVIERVWSFTAPGLGSYAVSFGGPVIFDAASIPDVSRATAGSYGPTVAAHPASAHPCSGVTYQLDFSSCGASTAYFMLVDGNGRLTIDTASLAHYGDGTYCIQVQAQHTSSQVYLQTISYTFQVGP